MSSKFTVGLDGSAWYLWSLHRLAKLPQGQDAETWVAGYLERPDTHPKA
jgi:hypothetical protein